MNSFLILVPAPLDEQGVFDSSLKTLLESFSAQKMDYGVLVESEKNARRRWISSGLPREVVANFVPYHEQNQLVMNAEIIKQMKNEKKRFLLISDEGLPAFFDPGQKLIQMMHQKQLLVTCLNFPCSPILALTLSGFSSAQFKSIGFPPVKGVERMNCLLEFIRLPETAILMDTAYRLTLTLEQIAELEETHKQKNEYFLALDLGRSGEDYYLGSIQKIMKSFDASQKKDFVLVKGPRL